MTLSVRIAEPGREGAPRVASFAWNSRVFMSADDLLTICAAELAENAAGVVRIQETPVPRDQGVARAVAHHRKVFLTPDALEPGTYEFVKDLEGGKKFYGTVRQALNAFASEVAEPEGVEPREVVPAYRASVGSTTSKRQKSHSKGPLQL
jgi:hypothetical protein